MRNCIRVALVAILLSGHSQAQEPIDAETFYKLSLIQGRSLPMSSLDSEDVDQLLTCYKSCNLAYAKSENRMIEEYESAPEKQNSLNQILRLDGFKIMLDRCWDHCDSGIAPD